MNLFTISPKVPFRILARVLKVCSPIRMLMIAFLSVPLFWSFGPLPRSSSEGFLVTFTPGPLGRGVEDSYLPLSFLSEYSSKVHKSRGFITSVPPSWIPPISKKQTRTPILAWEEGRNHSPGVICDPQGLEPSARTFERAFGIDLMNPHSQPRVRGILVSSKPTDEGCRRTHPKYLTGELRENCHDLYFFVQANNKKTAKP